jgi:hypothetical protein
MKAISTFVRKINIQDKEYNEYGSFWKYLREKIIIVAESNIRKIEKILTDKSPVDLGNLKDTYHNMDYLKLLIKQNEASCNGPEENRFIWVVNTFITILGEYKFFWKRNIESSLHNEGGVAK